MDSTNAHQQQNLYSVLLGIDRAAKPTGQTMTVTVLAPDRLTAGLRAEEVCDPLLDDTKTMYSHAVRVTQINRRLPAAVAA